MHQKIKICVVSTISSTISAFLMDQLLYLSNNGYDVTVMCNYDKLFAQNCPRTIKYIPFKMDRKTSLLREIKCVFYMLSIFYKNDYDIVQYCTPKAAFIASFASWCVGVPVRLYCQWGIRYVTMSGWKRRVLKTCEMLTCKLSTNISPDSFGNLEFSCAENLYSKQKGCVVHNGSANGVNLSRFDVAKRSTWNEEVRRSLKISKDAFIYGWVGRVTKDKGVSELISAFVKIAKHNSDVNLLMLGAIDEKHGITPEIIELMNNHPNIYYLGKQNCIERFYATMDVFVLPSYREGFGAVILEAQAMGVPVITTDIPGPREAIIENETGVLIKAKEVNELYLAMLDMKDNKRRREDMGRAGILFVKRNFEQNELWEKVIIHRNNLMKNIL